ncbi:lysylphosphatidylglycerol synthase transmembrane domain-containing protein [Nannocystis punicea]|uniref:Lysylphosphatidylglycerol synthase transmembrane domain-containing protein n=1 Tax=Nannocystis punicea TaxID=2995304 RepID=A0ABY7HEL5_9BACT|nr:lysylphosphatidylglycerol synthase transmembrane domain-containing protein [Nannocystis poenicansa]WAS97725.1 lysylphosphatidylglycerol synthase transmembrane domain-containing protein [Nannocystis poenicansa]
MTASPATAPTPAPARAWLRVGLSLVITGLALWLVQRQLDPVPDELEIAAWGLPAYLATLLLYAFLRSARWWFLVRPLGQVRFGDVMLVGLAGALWIVALPWRLGELVRPALLARRSGIPASQLLGTVAIERVVDGLCVCAAFFVAAAGAPDVPALTGLYAACTAAFALFAAALAVLVVLARWPAALELLLRRGLGRIAARPAAILADVARGLAEGLRALPSLRPLLLFLVGTVAYWGTNVFGMALLARACGLDLGPLEALAVLAVLNLTLLVPGPPAHVGTFQLGVAAGLGLFLPPDVVRAGGSTYAFFLYTCQLAMIAALGIGASLRLRLGWRAALDLRPSSEPRAGAPANA